MMTDTQRLAALPSDSERLLKQICADFPQCFSEEASEVRPIALGTRELLLAHYQAKWGEAVPNLTGMLKEALKAYTHSVAYAKASVLGAPRITLEGDVEGVVDEGSAKFGRYLCRKHRRQKAKAARRATPPPRQPQKKASTTQQPPAAVPPVAKPKRPKLSLKKSVMP